MQEAPYRVVFIYSIFYNWHSVIGTGNVLMILYWYKSSYWISRNTTCDERVASGGILHGGGGGVPLLLKSGKRGTRGV